jgi:Replication protein
MKTGIENNGFEKGKIYTLGESGTQENSTNPSNAFVSGEGTDILDNPSLKNRAKRKMITQKITLALVDVAKEKGEQEKEKAYWRAFHCQNKVIISDGKMYGKYCKNRFCTICCAIRKADIINRYYPTISKWKDAHFVTLTVKSCKAEKLNLWVSGMLRAFELIHNRCKKRNQREKGIKLIGIKSLECNFSPIKKTYNPHFHIIVPSKEIAELLKKEWLRQWKPKIKSLYRYYYTDPKAQKISKVTSLEHSLIETIKYGSKIFTDPTNKKKDGHSTNPMIYASALDNIFTAMKGKRLFDRFGFNLPPQAPKKNTSKFVVNYENWAFSIHATDWINKKTGECLTGHQPTKELSNLLNDCIDTHLY